VAGGNAGDRSAGPRDPAGGADRPAANGAEESIFSDPRITAVGLFTEAFTGLSAKFSAQFAEHNLAMAEFEVLLRLSRSPGWSTGWSARACCAGGPARLTGAACWPRSPKPAGSGSPRCCPVTSR
jgi:hypothetical protein